MYYFLQFVDFFDKHQGVVTLLAGLVAVILYFQARRDNRSDAAKLILQELRYADQKVRNYRTYSSYNFTEKILPTNSWNKNINYFIRELTESELDLISKFFSSASYLDEVIKAIADSKNKQLIQPATPQVDDGSPIAIGTGDLSANDAAKKLIEAVSRDIESIYNTPAADKLRNISKKRRFLFF